MIALHGQNLVWLAGLMQLCGSALAILHVVGPTWYFFLTWLLHGILNASEPPSLNSIPYGPFCRVTLLSNWVFTCFIHSP
jgi:hypothetical protein